MAQDVDDPTINGDDLLWRRIPNVPQMIKVLDGTYHISSAAFIDGIDGQVSVHLSKLTTIEKALAEHPEKGLVEITASVPQSLGHSVVHDPTPDDYSHTLIIPPKNKTNNTRKRDAREMAKAARWLLYPLSIRN
jgi:hypothetical protein